MFKTIQIIVLAALCLNFKAEAQSQNPSPPLKNQAILGKVISATNGEALPGAVIKVTNTNHTVISNDKGEFILTLGNGSYNLSIYYLSYKTKNISIQIPVKESLLITLNTDDKSLKEVEIVSTGYQNIPKERATGSFTLIDNELINRKVSTNILDRLDGVSSSLIFNKNNTGLGFNGSAFSVRGRSTINGDTDPLIVVDNFPYTGDISTINPNDVATVTLLKDAAAASIWGTKAGNGVLVITTKSGKFNQKTSISLTSNLTIGQKPKLFTQQQLTSKEYIEVEKFLFEKGQYNSAINNGYAALSPAVEILLMQRSGQIDLNIRDHMLDSLSQYDIRDELLKYYYQVPINQQYNLNISGGSQTQKYFLSGGYDKNLLQSVSTSYERFTLTGQNTYALWQGKVQLVSGIQFTNTKNTSGKGLPTNWNKYPYLNFADEHGNALAVPGDLRFSYIKAQEGKGLQDWFYRPLDELDPYQTQTSVDFRLSNSLTYNIIKPVKLSLYHTYQRGINTNQSNYDKNVYYTRNQVNQYTVIDPLTGALTQPISLGDILTRSNALYISNYARAQLSLDQRIFKVGSLSGIAGIECSDSNSELSRSTLYGYNPEIGTNANSNIDFTKNYPKYYGSGTSKISTGLSNDGQTDRYMSYFMNLSYNHDSKYTLSASARKDQSNIFGVKSNQKGVPLWSAGLAWEFSKESFYQFKLIPYLRLRATYGYNGNVDKSTSAYLTASPASPPTNRFGAPHSMIANPPNPSLRWEKVRNVNVAMDFATSKNRIKGSIELNSKYGIDLIATSPVAPQTGVYEFKGNSANLKTNGIEFSISTLNTTGAVKWNTTFLFNYVKDKVTRYLVSPGANFDIVQGNYNTPLVGYPYDANFSFKWAGLDNAGSPQAYFNDQISKDYLAIRNSQDRTNIVFNGSRSPTIFGSLMNDFSWKQLNISFNLVYKAGYNIRRKSLENVYGGFYQVNDYNKRWQKPGDEQITNVPSLAYPANLNRQYVYTYSDELIYSGNHIRLQDIRLGLDLGNKLTKRMQLKQISAFVYASNLGIIWKANKFGIDPDSPDVQQTRNISFGLSAQF